MTVDKETRDRVDSPDAESAASDYCKLVEPLDASMGWRLDDVRAAFIAGAAWAIGQLATVRDKALP